MKYDHAVAAAQKSTSGHTDAADDDNDEEEEEDDEGGDRAKKRTKQKSSLSAAEEEQKAAGLVEAVLKAHRKLQQLQASCCYCSPLYPVNDMLQDSISILPPIQHHRT